MTWLLETLAPPLLVVCAALWAWWMVGERDNLRRGRDEGARDVHG